MSQDLRDKHLDSANHYYKLGNNYQALVFFEMALEESKKIDNAEQITNDLLQSGLMHLRLGEMNKSSENYHEALRVTETRDCHDTLKFEALIRISYHMMQFDDLGQAEYYLEEAIEVAKRNDNTNMLHRCYTNQGILARMKGDYVNSIIYYKKAISMVPVGKTDKYGHLEALINLSTAYAYNKQYAEGILVLKEAEEININFNSVRHEMLILGQLGKMEDFLGHKETAVDYYLRGLKLGEENENDEMIRRFSRQLSTSYYEANNYRKAYDYYVVFVAKLEESLKTERAKAIAETSAKYQYEKKEQEIIYLSEQKALEADLYTSKIDRQQTIIWSSVLAIIFILGLAAYIYRAQKNKQRIQLLLNEKEKKLVHQQAASTGRDLERNRLSLELHDGLGGALASIKLRLSNQKGQDSLAPILKDLDLACQEVRNVSHSLSSSFVLASDFYSLLEKYTNDLAEQSEMAVRLDFLPKETLNDLSEETRHNCFRIIQELGTNALKHANASLFTIGLLLDEKTVYLQVEDDGDGLDSSEKELTGIGLLNVKDRVKMLEGEIHIQSELNRGMIISINFPFVT
ncbi:MAG: two-component system NarL family sensor kinase [Flavobacteriaceae bacterium]|jgi:two-component system NarL family sensor kinase